MSDQDVVLEGLLEKLRGSLERMEALQKQWGNPLVESSALRMALRAELQRASVATDARGLPGRSASPAQRAGQGGQQKQFQPSGPPSGLQVPETPESPKRSAPLTPLRAMSGVSRARRSQTELSLTSEERIGFASESLGSARREFSGTWFGRLRSALWWLVHTESTAFDSAIGLLIIASSFCVGVEIECELEGNADCSMAAHNLEHFFLVCFVLELLIRAIPDGREVLQSRWFLFDLLLVVLGIFSSWVVEPIILHTGESKEKQWLEVISKVLILRLLRLCRLVRALRMFEQFQEISKLANGLLRSLHTVISACLMILLVIYVLAVCSIELITRNESLKDDPDSAQVVEDNFSSLLMAMSTLLQFANADSITSVYKPLVEKAWYLAFYFIVVWLVITIKLMNLITAVIVDNAITQGDADREVERDMKRKRLRTLRPQIERIFLDFFEEFEMEIDRTTGEDLGIQWESDSSLTLRINAVTPGGLVQQWNEANPAYCRVKPGTRIVEVNSIRDDANLMSESLGQEGELQFSVKFKAGTGKLSKKDFRYKLKEVLADPHLTMDLPPDLMKILRADRIVDVCDYLDNDQSGEIDQDEFIDGIFSLMLQSVPIETTQMLQLLRSNNDKLRRIQRDVASRGRGQAGESRPPAPEREAVGARLSI